MPPFAATIAPGESGSLELPASYARLLKLGERDPRRSVALARQAYAAAADTAPAQAAWAAFTLGMALVRYEQPRDATPCLQAAQAHFQALGLRAPALHCRRAQLAAALVTGEAPIELQHEWDALALAYESLGLLLEAARARFDQIGHFNALGHPLEALALLKRITPTVERQGSTADQARLLRLTAVACRLRGDLDQASRAIAGAIERYGALRATPDLAKSLFERAIIFQRRDQFAAAQADLDAAGLLFGRLRLPLWQAYCAVDSGLIASRRGRYDEAIAATSEARAQLVELQRWDHVAGCDLNLANIAFYCGLFDLALLVYRRAERQFEAMDRPRLALICRRNQALTLHAQGQLDEALALLDRLPAQAEQLGEQVELAEAVLAQGLVLRELGRADAGRACLERAESFFSSLGNLPAAAACRLEQGWLCLEQGDLVRAEACLLSSQAGLADQPAHAWRVVYGLGRCHELRGALPQALALYRASAAIVAGLRRRLVSEHASSGIFRQAEHLIANALQLAFALDDAQVALELAEYQHAVALASRLHHNPFVLPPTRHPEFACLQDELHRLVEAPSDQAQIDAAVQTYVELLLHARHLQPLPEPEPPPSLDLHTLRARCDALFPRGWSILAYIEQRPNRLLTILVDAEHATMQTVALDAALQKALARATSAAQQPYTFLDLPYLSGQALRPWADLELLGTALIPAALRERLHADHRLLLIPGGQLQQLAWPALRLDGAWLVERALVQILPSLHVWLALLDRPRAGTEALLLGVSTFAGQAADLPNARPTLDLVARIWPHPVTRVEDQALTRAGLLESAAAGHLRRFGLLHVATHGQLAAARGLLAHLKLGADYLFYDDVARLDLAGALVVLAACEGGSGEVLPGEEVLSLSRALLAAGARDVLASSWPIYDNGILHLLEPLYRSLAAGADPPTALALAQRSLIAQSNGAPHDEGVLYSPLIWAGFAALGAGVP
jgi:tetratricopeptide (TPR) repeat protein